MGECVACMSPTTETLVPCGHFMCGACAMQWVVRKPTCPVCRGVVVALPPTAAPTGPTVVIDFPKPSMHVGITVSDARGGGVRVVALVRKDRAMQCGMRVGDVITHINGIPVRDHRNAAAISDRATQHGIALSYTLKARRSWWWWCLCW